MGEMLKKGLRLYYHILKLHSRTLPGQMRGIGDLYLRQEFKHHHENPQMEFYLKFYTKWNDYYEELSKRGVKEMARDITSREEQMLTNDQKEALKVLKEGIEKK